MKIWKLKNNFNDFNLKKLNRNIYSLKIIQFNLK